MSTVERGTIGRFVPKALTFLLVSAAVFGLAKLHLARPGLPKAAPGQTIKLGDFYNGETVFNQKCAACHGTDGKGGPVGPRLAGLAITLSVARAQIDAGGSTMPPALVKGKQEADVLAFLAMTLGKAS